MIQKAPGYIMIVAFVLGAMIVTLGLGVQKLLFTELSFAANLLRSERAHFAAESGIEQSLLWLEENEIEHLESYVPETILTEGVEQEITIANNVDSFTFLLQPEEAKMFILRRDLTPDARITSYDSDTEIVDRFEIRATSETPGSTFELNTCLGSLENNSIESLTANDNPYTRDSKGEEACIVMVYNQNVFMKTADDQPDIEQNNKRALTIMVSGTGTSGITPHKAEITAVGRDGAQEKIITFDLERNKSWLGRSLFVQ